VVCKSQVKVTLAKCNLPKAVLQSVLVRFSKQTVLESRAGSHSKIGLLLKIEPELIAGEPLEGCTLAKVPITLILNTTEYSLTKMCQFVNKSSKSLVGIQKCLKSLFPGFLSISPVLGPKR